MLKNYLKVAWRNLVRYRSNSLISILGLALGIGCCILLIIFIRHEWTYDRFHEESEAIYRIVDESNFPNQGKNWSASVPVALGPELEHSYGEIKQVVRVTKRPVEVNKENQFLDREILFADPGFFEMFSFPILRGDQETPLSNPDGIFISEEAALLHFGDENPLGRTIELKLETGSRSYIVLGIFREFPVNSSIRGQYLLPFENLKYTMDPMLRKFVYESWNVGATEVYLTLISESSSEELASKFSPFVQTYYGQSAGFRKLTLQSMTEIHLSPQIDSQIAATSNPLYSWILAGIVFVILLIACINFMSLTLGRAWMRVSEVGIRKVTGAFRSQIIVQFLGEAFLTCSIAFLLGLITAELALPYFQQLTGTELTFDFLQEVEWILLLTGLLVLTSFLTGLYPAIAMSRMKPVKMIAGSRTAEKIPYFVKALIIVQFTLATALIASTLIMQSQLDYLLTSDPGFNKDGVIVIDPELSPGELSDIFRIYREELEHHPDILEVSTAWVGYGSGASTAFYETNQITIPDLAVNIVGDRYLETMSIQLIAGRYFSSERLNELKNGVIVNQLFVDVMELDDPIGKILPGEADPNSFASVEGKEIIGVVDNYHYESMHKKLRPLALLPVETTGWVQNDILVRIAGGDVAGTLNFLEKIWTEITAGAVFSYSFLDDMIARQYEFEQRWKEIIQYSSVFAIMIASFGLLGLMILVVHRRTKEIGIRKVLGATMTSIVGLLSKDFVKLVILGFIIAVPIAWYVMNRWLQNFAYKVEIDPELFMIVGGVTVFIALATVSWQSVRAALANPVESLRSE